MSQILPLKEGEKNINQVGQGQWPVSKGDLKLIIALGREIHKTILDFATKSGGLHRKIMEAACQYMLDMEAQKIKALGDEFLRADQLIRANGLESLIIEPYVQQVKEAEDAEERARQESEKGKPATDSVLPGVEHVINAEEPVSENQGTLPIENKG